MICPIVFVPLLVVDDSGMRSARGSDAQKVFILRVDHALLRNAVRKLLFVASAGQCCFDRRRHVDRAAPHRDGDRRINVFVEVESERHQLSHGLPALGSLLGCCERNRTTRSSPARMVVRISSR